MVCAQISIVIPVYNETQRIDNSLFELKDYFSNFKYDYEIIFVDDGSSDNTAEKLEKFINNNLLKKFKLLKLPKNCGKGAAVKHGMLNAMDNSDLYFFMDADLSTPLSEINKFIEYYETHKTDILIGSRSLADSNVVVHQKIYRELMGKIFNKILKILIFTEFIDTQCGFKLFSPRARKKIFKNLKIQRFAFDVEIVFLAKKYNISIEELPVTWVNKENSRVHIIKDSFNMLCDVIKLQINWLLGKYEKK
ncbi:MAG TPA: glycosyltransferase family 2 protein [bacterium]|nr:glycosyltransferase family 2 protein [bacterium]